jgi:class I fructose-bisphosphate aldolase
MSDVTPNVLNLKHILGEVVAGGADAVLMSFGTAMRLGYMFRGKDSPAVLIRADWMNLPRLGGSNMSNVLPVLHFKKIASSQAKDALLVGASGITIYYFVGYSDEFEALNIEQAAEFAKECRKIGLPLIIEPMAVGGMVTGVNISEILVASARIAVEIGADALKIPYTGDVHTFRKLINEAKVPVLVLGGAKSDFPRDALELVDEALQAGASGTVFGRNVTKAKDPRKMVQDICALVHKGRSIEEILNRGIRFEKEGRRQGKLGLGGVSRNCTGCLLCELACGQQHYPGQFGTNGARLRIQSKPIDDKPPLHRVVVCTMCGQCVKACERHALVIGSKGYLELDQAVCDGCGECIEACPFELMWLDKEGKPIFCDMCEGSPQCVKWCKSEAIVVR